MESSAVILLPQSHFSHQIPGTSLIIILIIGRPRIQETFPNLLAYAAKRCVPGFGEASPEAKGAQNLHHFFTYVAVRIVIAQLQSYNPEAYKELMEFLNSHSLNDGDKFCADLMRESSRHKSLALRILEMVDESNTRITRDYITETSHVESEK